MTIQENVHLAEHTTFRLGGPARFFIEAENEGDVAEAFAWAGERGVPVFVLGGGSNLLVPDEGFPGLALRIGIRGVEQEGCRFTVGAGEPWDALVDRTVGAGCAGMECLAGIPGSTGGTPVQNVGAYGQEVSETITAVRAFDRREQRFVDLSKDACRFRYRASLFNTEEPGRYVVTGVRFALRAGGEPTLRYADLQRYFAGYSMPPTLPEVAAAVREIRGSKGMVLVEGDPDTQSAGSYFKNPVIATERLPQIAAAAKVVEEAVPRYPAGESQVKLSAAWLMERAGFGKGFQLGAAGLSTRHALAVTNRGGASCADVLRLEEHVRLGVFEHFGVRLEREPVLLGVGSG